MADCRYLSKKDISVPGFTNNFIVNHLTGYTFRTEWLPDGRPQLFINGVLVIDGDDTEALIQIVVLTIASYNPNVLSRFF